jgi:hypothetical protein
VSTTDRSARLQGATAGVVTFAVGLLPTAAILWSASSGSVGTVHGSGLGLVAVAVIGAVALGSGRLVLDAYRRRPDRRPGEVWSTWYSGFVAFVLGTWASPLLILALFIDSDRALDDRMPLVLAVWAALHLAFAARGAVFARGLLATGARGDGRA